MAVVDESICDRDRPMVQAGLRRSILPFFVLVRKARMPLLWKSGLSRVLPSLEVDLLPVPSTAARKKCSSRFAAALETPGADRFIRRILVVRGEYVAVIAQDPAVLFALLDANCT